MPELAYLISIDYHTLLWVTRSFVRVFIVVRFKEILKDMLEKFDGEE